MAYKKYSSKNLAQAPLAAVALASSEALLLETGYGELFPTSFPFKGIIEQFDDQLPPRVLQREMVECTNRVGDVLTVVRGAGLVPASWDALTQSNTPMQFEAGDTFSLIVTSEQFDDVQDEISRLGTDKLDKAGMTRTGLTAKRVMITDASGAETYLSGTLGQVVGFDGDGDPEAQTPTVDIDGLAEKTALDIDDEIVLFDSDTSTNKKQSLLRLFPWIKEFEAGETISTVGNPIQIKPDGKAYSSMDNIYGYAGINVNTVTAGQTVRVQIDGIAPISGNQNERKYLSLSSSNASTQKANLTQGLFWGSVASVWQYAYVMGGYTGAANPLTNYRYDTIGNTWSTMTALPFLAIYSAAGTDGTDVYIFRLNQANDGLDSGTSYKYSVSGNSYSAITNHPTGKANMTYASFGGNVYTFGGGTSGWTAYNTAYRYNASLNTYTQMANTPESFAFGCATVYNGKIWIADGLVTGELYSAKTWSYNPVTNTYATETARPVATYGSWMGTIGSYLYVFGGYQTGGTTTNRIDRYDPNTKTWTQIANLTLARAPYGQTVTIGSWIYVFGGNTTGTTASDRTEVITDVWTKTVNAVSGTYEIGKQVDSSRFQLKYV